MRGKGISQSSATFAFHSLARHSFAQKGLELSRKTATANSATGVTEAVSSTEGNEGNEGVVGISNCIRGLTLQS
jgi:hypothetical protein